MTRLRSSIHLRIVPLCAVTFLLALVTTQAAHALPNSVISELQQTESTDHNLFGVAVDVDGNRAVIGSMTPDYRDAPSSVYLYDFANPQSMMSLRILSPAAKPGLLDNFGQSIALSGSRLFVGAPNEGNRGVVYMFDISDLSNITYRTIVPFDVADYTSFGWSLAISGNRLVVGSPDHSAAVTLPPSVYLIDVSDPNNMHQSKIVPDPTKNVGRFGDSVDIDGNYLIVGDSGDNSAGSFVGAAYVYDLSNPNQILSKKIVPPDPQATSSFGRQVAISGTKALVTAVGDLGPVRTAGIGSGTVYLEDFSNWNLLKQTEFAAADTVANDSFGGNSDIDLIGNLAIVGAHGRSDFGFGSGAVYIMDVSNPNSIQQLAKIYAPGEQTSDHFGVVLATDGTSLVVTSRRGANVDSNPGRAYLFQVPEPSCISILLGSMSLCFSRRQRS